MLVSLTALGYLRIEDDRGNGIVYGAEVKTTNFLNGARHSVYYKRNAANALLLVTIHISVPFHCFPAHFLFENRLIETKSTSGRCRHPSIRTD